MFLKLNSRFPNNIKSSVILLEGIFMRDIESRSGVYERSSILEYNKAFISKLSKKFRRELFPSLSGTVQHKKQDNCTDNDYGASKLQQKSLNI